MSRPTFEDRRIDGTLICFAPGCPREVDRNVLYCGEQCEELARILRNDSNEIVRLDRDAAALAQPAERCRRCPGGAYCKDELGEVRCWCGFTYEGAVA